MEMQTNTTNSKMSAIERALAAAKARKAAKTAEGEDAPETSLEVPAPKSKAPKTKDTDEAKAARKAERDADRAARAEAKAAAEAAKAEAKAAKAAAREAAKAAKAGEKTNKSPAHMKKVEKARAKLPPLGDEMTRLFDEVTTAFPAGSLEVFAQHVLVQARALRTMRACSSIQLPLGALVRITGGEPKFLGMTGTVVHSQKLRAKVRLPGMPEGKYVYIYTGEAEVVAPDAEAAAE